MRTACVAALLAAAFTLPAFADTSIYKWVDDKGNVHYSTEPHSDQAQQLAIPNKGTLPNSPSGAPNATTAAAPDGATTGAAEDATLVRPQAADSPACKETRDRLFKFLHSDHLYSLDAKGNKLQLSPEDQQKAIDDARANAKRACNGGGT